MPYAIAVLVLWCGLAYFYGPRLIAPTTWSRITESFRSVLTAKEITEAEARKLAREFLAKEKLEWGKPSAVEKEPARFVLTYTTPKDEEVRLGKRQVLVFMDRTVSFVPRR